MLRRRVFLFFPSLLFGQPLDPAAWGSNHAGQPAPEFTHGDECLFCHRNDIGPGWQENAHGITVRQREDAPALAEVLGRQPALASVAGQVGFFLGGRNSARFLRQDGYGNLAILNTKLRLGAAGRPESWEALSTPAWDRTKFGARCAGCHATAVDSRTKTFAYFGLDCYTCHGAVDLNHTNDTALVLLSKKRRADAKVITSICAQCHLRGGRSRSTGLPYANNFVAGDNLFQDYAADFSKAADETLNAGDRHLWRNVRDAATGVSDTTCLACHAVHASSSAKHRRAAPGAICQDCHYEGRPRKEVKTYTVRSELCEY